jgi:Leucine-rich repeat (LRR) protein
MEIPNTIKKIFMHNNLLKEVYYKDMPNLSLVVFLGNQLNEVTLYNLPTLQDVYLNQNTISSLSLRKLPKV